MFRNNDVIRNMGDTICDFRVALLHTAIFLLLLCLPTFLQTISVGLKKNSDTLKYALELLPSSKDFKELVMPGYDNPNLLERTINVSNNVKKRIVQLDNYLTMDSFISKNMNPIIQNYFTKYFKNGNEKVVCGYEKWLFYKPDIEHVIGPGFLDNTYFKKRIREADEQKERFNPNPIQGIKEFHKMLKARGIELILLPVPVKPMIYPEKLSRPLINEKHLVRNKSYELFLEKLHDEGIAVIDVRQNLINIKAEDIQVYFKLDTHWTPNGMKVAVDQVAKKIKNKYPELCNRSNYIVKGRKVANYGDTQKMLKLPNGQKIFSVEETKIEEVKESDGKYWKPDPMAEILVLGDSFCNIFSMESLKWGEHAGFSEHLSYQLQSPVDVILQNDDAAHATIERLNRELRQGSDRLLNKRIVIWEFTARELSFGNWKKAYNWETSGRDNLKKEAIPAGISNIVVKVLKKSFVPNPKLSDYPNCLYAYKAEVYRYLNGVKTPEILMINSWAFKNSEYSETSRVEVGQFYEIEIEPMDSTSENLKRIMVADNINDLNTPVYFERKQSLSLAVKKEYNAPIFNSSINKYTNQDALKKKKEIVFSTTIKNEKEQIITHDITEIDNLIKQYGGVSRWIQALGKFQAELSEIRIKHIDKYTDKYTFVGRNKFLFDVNRSRFLINKTWQDSVLAGDKKSDMHLYPRAYESIIQTRDWLKERSIDLIVVPIPSRAEVYSDFIADVKTIPYVAPHRILFNRKLLQKGVEVVDLMPNYIEERQLNGNKDISKTLYCKDDPHWNTEGIKIAAKIIADRLKRYDIKSKRITYDISRIEQNSNSALLKNLPEDLNAELFRQKKVVENVTNKDNLNNYRDENSPVLLCGDSYLRIFNSGGFPSHLSRELGYSVDTITQSGGGPIIPKLLISKKPEYLEKKYVVIWFFVARYLPSKSWILISDLQNK